MCQHVEHMHKMIMFHLAYSPSPTILVFLWFQELRYQLREFQWITKWSWPNVKMSITTWVYLRRGPSGPNPRQSGPKGRPAQDLVDTSLRRFTRKDLRLEGGGGREEWPADHVEGRPAVHLLQTSLAKSVETPLYTNISPPTIEDSTIHSTCSSPLVKITV
jgi:hypothetical protein